MTADINITDYLKFSAQSTLTWGNTNYSSYGSTYNPNKSSINGDITKYQQNATRTNNVQTLSFFKNFGANSEHYVNVMAGHEYYRTNTRYLTAMAAGRILTRHRGNLRFRQEGRLLVTHDELQR